MNHLYVSIVIFLLLSSCGFMMLTSGVDWKKKVFVSVALILAGMLTYRAMNMLYGYPSLLQSNMKNVLILGYWPDKPNNTMYIWVKETGKQNPTSYRMPYSPKLDKALEKGRQKHKGKPYRANLEGNKYPLERFDESMDGIRVHPLPSFPPKELTE